MNPTPPFRRRRGNPPTAWVSILMCLIGLGLAVRAGAQEAISFTAQCDPTPAMVGAPLRYKLTLVTNGTRVSAEPVIPDWGGLNLRGGPMSSSQMSYNITNGSQTVRNFQTYEYQLTAPKAGRYTIPAARISVGGKTYASQAVTVEAVTRQPASVPVQFQGESIISAQTDDENVNRQLDGRLFLRLTVSNKTPYVREPVIVTCSVYDFGFQPPMRYEFSPGEVQGGVVESLLSGPNRLNFQQTMVGDKQFLVATAYRAALTPTKAGKLTLQGLGMKVALPVRRRGNDPFNDPFGMLDDPFFGGGGIQAEMPTAPLELDVRPLPTEGQPANFTGTVGDFTLRAEADPKEVTEDDLVTLKLTLEGKGNVDLAYQPVLPPGGDFQVVGQSTKAAEKSNTPESIGGRRTFELVLRPARAGALQIPAIHYPIFNPAKGQYADLATPPTPIKVTPGKTPGTLAPATPAGSPPPGTVNPQEPLRYRHPISDTPRRRPEPLLESMTFWLLHLAAAGLVLGAWKRNRRLANLDPARARRSGAWRGLERRLHQIRQQKGTPPPQELAGQVDQAARAFIADRFNLSADGLTRVDIERLLRERAVPEARIQRLCDLLERCETLHYAPLGSIDGELDGWVNEIVTIFKENLHE